MKTTTSFKFEIATADCLRIDDSELVDLLTQVYVGGGFTTSAEAATLFEPPAVRARGIMIGAHDNQRSKLAGVIIVVPPDSPARRLAKNSEAELHLLAIKPEYRRHGLGRMLVTAAIEKACSLGCSKLILWTQFSMRSAQQLYESAGFAHTSDMKINDREFRVYERDL